MDIAITEFLLTAVRIQIRLHELYKLVDSDQLLVYLCHFNNATNSKQYEDYQAGRNHLIAEFVGMYYLYHSHIHIKNQDAGDFLIIAGEFQTICEKLISLQSIIRRIEEEFDIKNESDLNTVTSKVRQDSAIVKNAGFPFHHEEIMLELYRPYERDIEAAIGFRYSESISIVRAIPEIIENRMSRVYSKIQDEVNAELSEIRFYRKKGRLKTSSKLQVKDINYYRTISNSNLEIVLKNRHVNSYVEESIAGFTLYAKDLTDYVDLSEDKINRILSYYSARREDVIYFPDLSYGLIPFLERPYLQVGKGYIIPSVRNITWAASFRIDALIKSLYSGKKAEKYKKYKHDHLLELSLKYLYDLMPDTSFMYANSYYHIDDLEYEVDGLIKIDNYLLVIELKSQSISDPARRGYKSRVEKQLKEIIVHPHEQASRFIGLIRDKKEVRLRLSDGRKIDITLADAEEVIPVSVTLAQLGHITAGLKKDENIIFDSENPFPWTVNIYDLKIICDLCRNSAELINFVREREIFLEETRLTVYDELDIFSYYQDRTLTEYSSVLSKGEYGWGHLWNATDEVNHYYFNQYGDYFTQKINKPTLKLPKSMVDFVSRLVDSGLPHRIDTCILLYSMAVKTAAKFIDYFDRIRKKCRKSKSYHDFTIAVEDKDGRNIAITLIVDIDQKSFGGVNMFIRDRRAQDMKLKKGFIVNIVQNKASYKPVDIVYYDN